MTGILSELSDIQLEPSLELPSSPGPLYLPAHLHKHSILLVQLELASEVVFILELGTWEGHKRKGNVLKHAYKKLPTLTELQYIVLYC